MGEKHFAPSWLEGLKDKLSGAKDGTADQEEIRTEVQEKVAEKIRDVLAEIGKDKAVDKVFSNPEISSFTSLKYMIEGGRGQELKSGRRLIFVIPPEFVQRIVRDVILCHRKPEAYRVGTKAHDTAGAYDRVELHDREKNTWVGWKDPRGYSCDKYAEWRPESDPEVEVLHDWVATVGEIQADALRVSNVGQDPELSVSQIHGIEIVFFPDLEGASFQEKIYTPGTQFTDLEKKRLQPAYGGGSHTEGVYKGAVALNKQGDPQFELGVPGKEANLECGKLIIDLPAGKSLIQAEISVGDTEHLATVNPKTGRHTRLGYAKLSVGIQRAETKIIDWFIESANVPPQGVMAGSPLPEKALIKQGDKLVIEASQDTAYVMGWRLATK